MRYDTLCLGKIRGSVAAEYKMHSIQSTVPVADLVYIKPGVRLIENLPDRN